MAIRKALTPNSNVGFKFGTQAAADKIIADGVGAVEGSFYLTDAHRLYIGAANDAANGYTLYSVNEGVISVDSISNLTAYTAGTPDAIANTGRFFYIKDVNILAVFNGSEYVQINKYSENSIDKVEITGSAAQNVAEITTKVIDKNKNVKQQVITEEIEEDAPIIPLEEMLEEVNLDEMVQDDDDDEMVLAGSSEEEN